MLTFLLECLKKFFVKILQLFGFGGPKSLPSPQPEMLSVFVRTNIGEKVHVELAPEWTVAKVKAQLVPQLNTKSQQIRLIFAGKELPDNLVLSECDLGQNSILHAVRIVTTGDAAADASNATVSNTSTSQEKVHPTEAASSAAESDIAQRLTATTLGQSSKTGGNVLKADSSTAQKLSEAVEEPRAIPGGSQNTPPGEGIVSEVTCGSDDADTEAFTVIKSCDVEEGTTAGECDVGGGSGDDRSCQRLLCDASTVITIQLTQQEQEQLKQLKEVSNSERPHFYVYCVRPCAGVRVGKLRVRCATCKQGAVTLHSDPNCWADVLNANKMLCSCATPECSARSSDSYAEFYFKCSDHVTTGDDDISVPLYLIRANLPGVVCLSCGDVATPVIVFQCEASHVTCLDCFITYCLSKLSERQFTHDPVLGYTLPCPVNCPDSLIEEVHHFRLLGDEQYVRYQHWATEEAVLAAGGVLCPRPGCGHGLLPDPDCVRITCIGGCGFVFCRHCLQEYHTGECWQTGGGNESLSSAAPSSATFNVNTSRSSGVARWDVATAAAIQSLTKPCPKCRTPTERSGGCMHMVCTRASCRYNWCWVCHTEWTRDCMASHWFG